MEVTQTTPIEGTLVPRHRITSCSVLTVIDYMLCPASSFSEDFGRYARKVFETGTLGVNRGLPSGQ